MRTLDEMREHLDRLDTAIVLLLAERLSLIPKIAEIKQKEDLSVAQASRENEILQDKRELAKTHDLNPELIKNIWKLLLEESRTIQKKIITDKEREP